MKKILAILLTVFYFGSSSGMVYNLHYCLDEIFISVGAQENDCDICDRTTANDCCKSAIKIVKTDIAQKANLLAVDFSSVVAILPLQHFSDFIHPIIERNYFSILINAPPDKEQLPLFITYCNFRI